MHGNPAEYSARAILADLPVDTEGPERALAFRRVAREAGDSEESREVFCALYRLLANGKVPITSLYDVQMYVSGLTECLDLVPMVRSDVNRFLDLYLADQHNVCGLWRYVLELHALHAQKR